MANPPVLIPPVPGRPLLLYVSTTETSIGCVLAQHDDSGKRERAVYYISKTLIDYEKKYTPLEKTCLAVAWAAQKLRHYMLAHPVKLLAKMDPPRKRMRVPPKKKNIGYMAY